MPDTIELARREGVELVRTGRFQTLTGSWNPTPADIKAAVEAMDCPAIRKPVIRIGHTDSRFQISGDGEPALGWFENLRATDGGHTLVADQVTLPWLHSVQAAAYPSRSIEGNYNHRCSEGHTHPFVIHTVALLGVTPPGVQTLRSLNDLPEMLGVAASGEVPEGAQLVQVTVMASDGGSGSALDAALFDAVQAGDPLDFLDVEDVAPAVSAADGNDNELKRYWLHGEGLKRWAGARHPWTTLYRLILKHVGSVEKAKRIASDWYREHFGHMPNQHVKASDAAPAVEQAEGSAPAALPEPEQSPATPTETPPPVDPAPELPAAEPEPVNNPDPKEADPVSTTDLSVFRSRLGLSDDADETAITAAIDELKAKADNPQPTPEMVAASAAATEKATKAEEAQTLLKEELNRLSGELATIKASAAATVKASFFQGLKTNGQLKPADEETWSARYDRDPEMVTEILTARAPGSEVPVMASGVTGPAEPEVDDEFEAMMARIDAPTGKAA